VNGSQIVLGEAEVTEPAVTAPRDATIRTMRGEDIEAVLDIEGRQFSSPWSAQAFEGLIERSGAELWVVEHDEAGVIAYAVLWCILDQGELANVAVRPDFARQGYARRLLDEMFAFAKERGVESVYLEVRASNGGAADLYRSFGFTEVGLRKKYYDEPKEDAVVMRMEF
jgi:[ribosomal protein S18]-alanine N-acetyltransferase